MLPMNRSSMFILLFRLLSRTNNKTFHFTLYKDDFFLRISTIGKLVTTKYVDAP